MPANSNARAAAAVTLRRVVFGGRSLDTVLNDHSHERDGALIRELSIGSVRHYFSLSNEISSRLSVPLKPRDSILHCLLVVGAYQLRHTRIPTYAAVSETVGATRQVGRPWARGLVNHVLRNLSTSTAPTPASDEIRWDHPAWLIDLIRADYPGAWQAILDASLSRAPLTLRVNLQRKSRDQYLDLLATSGVSAHLGLLPETIVLDAPAIARNLPGYPDGTVSVQDEGAQRAAELLATFNGQRVLDACAAPGGKAMHLLERTPGIALVALDRDPARCTLMRQECLRHGYDAGIVIEGDANNVEWWDGRKFDRILLDAPCSGTGTLRRHPDIKLLKRATDIPQYQQTQVRMLANLWRTLAPGGRLLYCTCSVLSVENDAVISRFRETTMGASVELIRDDWGMGTQHGRQLLPSIGGADGFYYSIIVKR